MISSYIFVRVTAAVKVAGPALRIVYLLGCIKYFKGKANNFVVYNNGALLGTDYILLNEELLCPSVCHVHYSGNINL
jgi:hypothetical protein